MWSQFWKVKFLVPLTMEHFRGLSTYRNRQHAQTIYIWSYHKRNHNNNSNARAGMRIIPHPHYHFTSLKISYQKPKPLNPAQKSAGAGLCAALWEVLRRKWHKNYRWMREHQSRIQSALSRKTIRFCSESHWFCNSYAIFVLELPQGETARSCRLLRRVQRLRFRPS